MVTFQVEVYSLRGNNDKVSAQIQNSLISCGMFYFWRYAQSHFERCVLWAQSQYWICLHEWILALQNPFLLLFYSPSSRRECQSGSRINTAGFIYLILIRMHSRWPSVGNVCVCVCVQPHIHMYGNTVDGEGRNSTAKFAKRLLISFLLEFHSILKNIYIFLILYYISLSISLPISLSLSVYISTNLSVLCCLIDDISTCIICYWCCKYAQFP